jgi:hypothetical protein
MDKPVYIEKTSSDPDGLDFFSLKKEGITHLQNLCGKAWTDYNLHDPGITILEQLCYALTDMAYRTEFETADYLTLKDGSINFEEQALYRPQDIFPSQAITINDYRKLIVDSTAMINNVWVRRTGDRDLTDRNGHPRGLYSIYVQLPGQEGQFENNIDTHQIRKEIMDQVKRVYAANRNLGEDLKEVVFVEPEYISLHGIVEIDGHRDPADILAEIYFKGSRYLGPGIRFYSYEEIINRGKSYEEVFTGPLTKHGYILNEDLDQGREYALISELIGLIGDIEGVEYVEELSFGGGRASIRYDPELKSLPLLLFPKNHDPATLRLRKNQREYRISLGDARVEYERLNFEDQALRHTRQDIARVCPQPQGEHRPLNHYYSIQNHFPEIYGIGEYGVPEPAWPDSYARSGKLTQRKARARQLKAYLVFFEQIMANFLENLKELPRLFSLDADLKNSYFHLLLTNKIVPDIEEIYRTTPDQVDSHIAQLLDRYDNFEDRRSRILDYLLGIYGEKFTQSSLRRFHNYYSGQETEDELILNKITFLKNIVALSQNRARAYNYHKPSWDTDNICCLKKKVSILLGLKNLTTRSLAKKRSNPLENEGCHIVEHILLWPSGQGDHSSPVPAEFYSFRISVIFPSWTPRFKVKEFRKLAEETVRLNCPAHIQPGFYWLSFEKMEKFEKHYRDWLAQKCDPGVTRTKLDDCANRLTAFLREHQHTNFRESEL